MTPYGVRFECAVFLDGNRIGKVSSLVATQCELARASCSSRAVSAECFVMRLASQLGCLPSEARFNSGTKRRSYEQTPLEPPKGIAKQGVRMAPNRSERRSQRGPQNHGRDFDYLPAC